MAAAAAGAAAARTDDALLNQWSTLGKEEGDLTTLTSEELLERWDSLITSRDDVLAELQSRDLYPSQEMNRWEADTGAYPSQEDPAFLAKLLAKREFAESLQTSWRPKYDACGEVEQFEVTPVQRFVSNLMNPRTPYMSALLYHGVGVGKTCSAIQIAEGWLGEFPRQKVLIITPPTIREGFMRTIFDSKRLKLGEGGTSIPNNHVGCTGNRYLELTNSVFEREVSKIEYRVRREINRRYSIMGYISFANYIQDLLKKIPVGVSDERREKLKGEIIRREFSGRLLIVDEAHNLRDLPDDVADAEPDAPGGPVEKADAAAGKLLTPFLRDVLKYSEGMKLVLMTATPMYDNYREIIFILNLLLMNDKKATLTESKIFDKKGDIRAGGEALIAAAAMRYISFMRGENPLSFPIRLKPTGIQYLTTATYPAANPRGGPVGGAAGAAGGTLKHLEHLPIVPIELKGESLEASRAFTAALPEGTGGLSSIAMTQLVQAANFVAPPTSEDDDYSGRIGESALGKLFTESKVDKEIRYTAAEEPEWLGIDQIGEYAPKFEFLIKRLTTCEGVAFVYTRFVKGSAVPLALALEANGYTPYGRKRGLLGHGPQTPGGRQCAICPKREKDHMGAEADHFTPAYYGLLTGDVAISPNNEAVIKAERDLENAEGKKMKVIIGSQIASEGVDLRFVREAHILDSWYHLSKIEQIVGRAIRFCSHSALPVEKRNTTVYLYAAAFPAIDGRETADLYSYRLAFFKARQVGRVTRILKQHAIDCNLNHDAIIIKGEGPVKQIDSQRLERTDVNINDQPFTALCDWTEDCDYECKPRIKVDVAAADDSTYDEFTAAWLLSKLKEELRQRFAQQAAFSQEQMSELIEAPSAVRNSLLLATVGNKAFQVEHAGKKGYIRYCNGYYVFQPNVFVDLAIPLALRMAKFPVKRDYFEPEAIEEVEEMPVMEEAAVAAAGAGTAGEFWSAVVDWAAELAASPAEVDVPAEVIERLEQLAGTDKKVEAKLMLILEMIRWFQRSYHKSSRKNERAARHTIKEFFWDNWLRLSEQEELINDPLSVGLENRYDFDGMAVDRFLDPKDGTIVFMCDGDKCTDAIIRAVKKSKTDAMSGLVVNQSTTGDALHTTNNKGKETIIKLVYGFCVPKKGQIVFKTNIAPIEGPPGRGAECATVSTMKDHVDKLVHLGMYMRGAGIGDFDLREDTLYGSRKVSGAGRVCILMELVLRYMDLCKIGGRRWFYRPVAAAYTGHKGK